jgi:hypothetical protein
LLRRPGLAKVLAIPSRPLATVVFVITALGDALPLTLLIGLHTGGSLLTVKGTRVIWVTLQVDTSVLAAVSCLALALRWGAELPIGHAGMAVKDTLAYESIPRDLDALCIQLATLFIFVERAGIAAKATGVNAGCTQAGCCTEQSQSED